MKYELTAEGAFVCDCPDEDFQLDNWTKDKPPQPCHSPRYIGERLVTGEWVGHWVDEGPITETFEQASVRERLWRDYELARADVELNKVQDGVGVGTVGAWREYRCALRDWPVHDKFPNEAYRPIAPK